MINLIFGFTGTIVEINQKAYELELLVLKNTNVTLQEVKEYCTQSVHSYNDVLEYVATRGHLPTIGRIN